jgi:hypothetical protein
MKLEIAVQLLNVSGASKPVVGVSAFAFDRKNGLAPEGSSDGRCGSRQCRMTWNEVSIRIWPWCSGEDSPMLS